jgi:hypothetical protein
MKKYYIHNGHDLDGPYTTEEVQKTQLSVYQSIWYETSSGFTTVDDLQELRALRNEPLSYKGAYKGVLPITSMNKKLNEGSKVVSMLKKAYAALFY